MELKLKEKTYSWDEETYTYVCPCGKGKVVEYKETVPGFRSHTAYILCKDCDSKYELIRDKRGYYNQVKEKSNA